MDRKYLMTAFGYGIVGLVLGIYMAASKNHSQLVTHAHIMLLGFVVSFIYAVIYKLWQPSDQSLMAKLQYYGHQLGTLLLVLGLYCLYGGLVADKLVGPLLGVASIITLAAFVLMKILVIKALPR